MTIEHIGMFMWSGIAIVGLESLWHRFRKKPKPAEPNELDALVEQERFKQATPLAIAAAMHMPLDVKALTLVLHYEDGHKLHMECGKPERMEVEP